MYRGPQTTNLTGRYLFGDFGSGRIWAWIAENASQPRQPTLLLDSALAISSFGQGNDGELYVVNWGSGPNTGTLHRVVFQAATGGAMAPSTLSATGCVNPTNTTQPASGLIPYTINAPFWSDNAVKDRYIGLPNGQSIAVQQSGDWDFPNGTVLVKNFRVGTRLVETRLFMRHPDGNWGGFSYAWNAQQTDATLVQGGATRDIGGGQNWIFPSESQCLECHTGAAGRSLGLETAQLNRTFTYPQTGRTANELATLNAIGTLSPPIVNPAAEDPSLTLLIRLFRSTIGRGPTCTRTEQYENSPRASARRRIAVRGIDLALEPSADLEAGQKAQVAAKYLQQLAAGLSVLGSGEG